MIFSHLREMRAAKDLHEVIPFHHGIFIAVFGLAMRRNADNLYRMRDGIFSFYVRLSRHLPLPDLDSFHNC